MPDITMCSSKHCPEMTKCYRARAKPDYLQSWSNFEYLCNEDTGFEYFIKNISNDLDNSVSENDDK